MMRRCLYLRCPKVPSSATSTTAIGKTFTTTTSTTAVNSDDTTTNKTLDDVSSPSSNQQGQSGGPRRIRISRGTLDDWAEQKKSSYAFFCGFLSVSLISLGLTFAFVPLYRLYCSVGGRGFDARFYTQPGTETPSQGEEADDVKKLITVYFQGDVGNTMPISFIPLQRKMEVLVGEPTLAFFCAYNKSKRTLLGVSTYNISPSEVTNYLNKIQCFCFEEQRFKPNELVELPVFFYIHKDFNRDPMMKTVKELILTYTFFSLERTRESIQRSFMA